MDIKIEKKKYLVPRKYWAWIGGGAVLIYQPSGETLFNIPLTQYLLLSSNVEAAAMLPQEYLDRQDRYNLIFFLEPTNNPSKPYMCLQMQVNGWIIRINNAELDK